MITIENSVLQVQVSEQGAELQSVFNKRENLEYMWSGDPNFWAKRSPVLFPIVGTLKENTFTYEGKSYTLNRHGFARDRTFETEVATEDMVTFLLNSDRQTLEHFPFPFQLRIEYSLFENRLSVAYQVSNPGTSNLYFSIGGHPAFRVPLVKGLRYEDFFLKFNEEETKPRWPISPEGLLEKVPVPLLHSTDTLPLTKSLFSKDAIVLKYPSASVVSLISEKTTHGLDFSFDGFPFLGIWAAKDADFVCIEPWCGLADPVDSDQEFTTKEGIEVVAPGMQFLRTWKITCY